MVSVIGLDLSLTAAGIADRHGGTVTAGGAAKLGDWRLAVIRAAVLGVITDGCDLAVIEDLPKNAMAAGITGMVHGAVRSLLIDHQVPYVLVVASNLKKYATGNGSAGKPDMAVAAFKRAGIEFADDNQCDAWWLRVMALDFYGHPMFDLPKVQRDALKKPAWPVLTGDPA